jgi:3-oxoacyl-[acyl-carrier-protein] synthase II
MLGATSAVEAVACVMTIENGTLPATCNYEEPDPDCDLDWVPNVPRAADVRVALSNSMGFGGHNVVVAFSKV